MKKKLFSLVCACALVFSAMASMIVAEAAPNITYALNFEKTNQTLNADLDTDYLYYNLHDKAPIYKATLTVKGATPKTPVFDENKKIIAFTGALVNGIQASIKYESSQKLIMISTDRLTTASAGSVTVAADDPTVLTASLGISQADSKNYLKTDTIVATWYFFEENGNDIADMKLYEDTSEKAVQKVQFGELYDGTSMVAEKDVATSDINFINYPTTYAVTKAATENGTFTVDKETAAADETVTITTAPNEGYEVDTVTAGAEKITAGAENGTYTFVMPAKAVEVAVTFKAKAAPVDPNAAEKLKGSFTDGANDNAVAFKKTYTAADLTGKTGMLLKAKIDGKEYPYRKGTVLSLPNLDGDATSLTLGIVIQYADAKVNVESLAIELQ